MAAYIPRPRRHTPSGAIALSSLFFLSVLLASCAAGRREREKTTANDLETVADTRSKAAISVADSVSVERLVLVRGDTVHVSTDREHIRTIVRSDTFVRTDTLRMVSTITDTVETAAELSKWQRFRLDSWPWMLLALVGLSAYSIKRLLRNRPL